METIEQIAKIFALLVIPIAVAVTPAIVTSGMKAKEMDLEYTKLAITILQNGSGTSDDAIGLREWAVDILNN